MGTACRVQTVWCDAQADLIARLKATTFAGLIQPPTSTAVTLAA
jgi:hypothetical protein